MIQANELRIGNYLKTPEGAFMTVKTLKQDDDDILVNERNGMFTLNYTAFPIPLTEEILLKCGFSESKYGFGNGLLKFNFHVSGKFYPRIYDTTLSNDLKHLHQLQNLYFALTGKELEVKLCP